MLIEVHILQNHAPSNLNRDDTGSPKEAVFGGYKRARISSQCLKRSIRRSDGFQSLFQSGGASTRTRSLPTIIRERLLADATSTNSHEEKDALLGLAEVAAQKLTAIAKSDKKGQGEKKPPEADTKKAVTAQTIFFRSDEISRIFEEVKKRVLWDRDLEDLLKATKDQREPAAKKAIDALKGSESLKSAVKSLLGGEPSTDEDAEDEDEAASEDNKPSKKKTIHDRLKTLSIRHGAALALARAAGVNVDSRIPVDMALFGRMVTNPAFLHVEASSQFAHAISTHKIDHEFDYYTAVDDLERSSDDEAGSGADMIGDVEFNSACYYKYFNVHIEGLLDNLTGKAFKREVSPEDQQRARDTVALAVRAVIEAACRVTPSGKQNSFAAHQVPSVVWVEIRDQNLPVSYANAFCDPVNAKSGNGLERNSAAALKREVETTEKMYGLKARKRCLLTKHEDVQILGVKSAENLNALLDCVETEVKNG